MSRSDAGAPEIHGLCDDRFAAVREAFARNFAEHDELGAAVALTCEERLVVDLWAGWSDAAKTRPWKRDTIVNVFSVGKALAALCAHILVERDRLDPEAPVARYWPEFAKAGKEAILVRQVLCHQAGLPAIRRVLPSCAMLDWELMISELAAERPWWEPGKRHGYHVNTFGFLVGELVRRVSGRSFDRFFREEVADPLALDFHFGLDAKHDARTAEFQFIGARSPEELRAAATDGTLLAPTAHQLTDDERTMVRHAYANPPEFSGAGTVNTRAWRAAVLPSTNGHADARSVARAFGAMACGGAIGGKRVVRSDTIERAIREQACGLDAILFRPSRFALGFQLTQPERPVGPNARTFGQFGAGGSLGFADPDAGLGIGYVMNSMGARWQNPRNRGLIEAIYASL
jgi:CubicO group peptidase (beta-lactamase class C family)